MLAFEIENYNISCDINELLYDSLSDFLSLKPRRYIISYAVYFKFSDRGELLIYTKDNKNHISICSYMCGCVKEKPFFIIINDFKMDLTLSEIKDINFLVSLVKQQLHIPLVRYEQLSLF